MRSFERRISKLEEELNMGEEDKAAQWEALKKYHPDLCQAVEDFCKTHQNDPDILKDAIEGKLSDETVGKIADFCLTRVKKD